MKWAISIGFGLFATQIAAQDLPVFDGSHFGKVVVTDNQSALGRIRNEALIGAQNIEFISNYSANSPFAQLGRAVGKLDILTDANKFAPCTAFLISDNRLITNYHCVPGVLDHPQIGGTAIAALQVHFGFIRDGIKGDTQSFNVSPVPLEMNEALDYAVLKVLGDPNADFGALDLSDTVPEDRAPFWVIGHPLGEAQRISREKCQASAPAIEGNRVLHTCDTMPGSSGSPVIDAGLRQVVALHNASAGSVNLAVPMAEILAQSGVLTAVVSGSEATDDLTAARDEMAAELAALRAERAKLQAEADQKAAEAAEEARRLQDELAALRAEQARLKDLTETLDEAPDEAPLDQTTDRGDAPAVTPEEDLTPHPNPGRLGARVQELTDDVASALNLPDSFGVLVSDVPEGPAKAAGVLAGDVLRRVDGRVLRDTAHLLQLVASKEVGTRLTLTIWRKKREISLTMTTGPRAAATTPASQSTTTGPLVAGMRLAPLDKPQRERLGLPLGMVGLVVTDVAAESAAYEIGLRGDDMIREADQSPMSTAGDLERKISDARSKGRKTVLLLVYRDAEPRFVALTVAP